MRPAPIQVNFLGYPGTMGADFIDHILVDRFIVPPDHRRFFSERPAYMPHCYVPNDTTRGRSAVPPARADCGLPEAGFVFCCFNNAYKITPQMFDVWARIVTAVPGSVLWLLGDDTVKRNLTAEWIARGVDPARLVFAPRASPPEHLARHVHADLFIDTFRYNAHTTTTDALWMGVPVLTCSGETFASRVAGSMLTAVGLPDLIAADPAGYEALAVKLATEAGLLAGYRGRLQENRRTMPLFDIPAFTRALEDTLEGLWREWLAS
jgi:predicted O-linked N-acetylglucosamine transferase (SPINDLY family)